MLRAMVPWTRRLPRPLETFENEFAEMMDKFFRPEEGHNGLEKFAPRSNLAETEKGFEVTVELPGMKPEEFNVEFRNGELWVTGEKKEEKEEKGKTFHRMERHYGAFRRVIPLDLPVDQDKVEAKYHDGVLEISVAKGTEAETRRIEVKT